MTTKVRIDQIMGVPTPVTEDVNKALVYKGNNIFDFEVVGTDGISALQASLTTLDTRVDNLEASSITSVDGGEY